MRRATSEVLGVVMDALKSVTLQEEDPDAILTESGCPGPLETHDVVTTLCGDEWFNGHPLGAGVAVKRMEADDRDRLSAAKFEEATPHVSLQRFCGQATQVL